MVVHNSANSILVFVSILLILIGAVGGKGLHFLPAAFEKVFDLAPSQIFTQDRHIFLNKLQGKSSFDF